MVSMKQTDTITATTTTIKALNPPPHLPQPNRPSGLSEVTEVHLSGLHVTVQIKQHDDDDRTFKGRITFFSRSNCRDCTAVRSFLRDLLVPYVEINLDVYPSRESDLRRRTGGLVSVPQLFLNERLVGGLVEINKMRKSGEFDRAVREIARVRCPGEAPEAPVYEDGDGDGDEDEMDQMAAIVRVVRGTVEVRDRISKMKIVRSCFVGSELVEAVIEHLDCGRKEAVEIGKELVRRHFIHHVFRENDFEDGNHLYQFLEHDPLISKCFNIAAGTNDYEPRPASVVGQHLTKLMIAILEAYTSDDRRHIDYNRISVSEEFRRYVNLTRDLQRVDTFSLSVDEKMAFFLNLYNAMIIHAIISIGRPEGMMERRSFFNDFHYMIGGYPYSLSTIKHGILRSNRRQPYSFAKPFGAGDKRLELVHSMMNPLVHFAICDSARSSPAVRFFSSQGIDLELRQAAREFFQSKGGLQVDLEKRTVYLTPIIKWYDVDFGQEKEILKWVLTFLDPRRAGLLTHLLDDGGPVNVVYQKFDWSLNL